MNPDGIGKNSGRKFQWLPLCAGMAIFLFMLAIIGRYSPAEHGFYPQCPFHKMTGLNCPGCGSLRAIHEILHGRFLKAFQCNALLVLSVPLVLVYLGSLRRRLREGRFGLSNAPRPLIVGLVVLALLFSIVRNLGVYPFTHLLP